MQHKVKEFNESKTCHREPMPVYARLLDIESEIGELAKEYLKNSKYGTKDFEMTDDFKNVSYIMDGKAWRELVDVSGDAMIGCFNYKGHSAFYVVNYDNENAQKVTLNFANNYDMKVIQSAETEYVNTQELELAMAAGEGVLIVME